MTGGMDPIRPPAQGSTHLPVVERTQASLYVNRPGTDMPSAGPLGESGDELGSCQVAGL